MQQFLSFDANGEICQFQTFFMNCKGKIVWSFLDINIVQTLGVCLMNWRYKPKVKEDLEEERYFDDDSEEKDNENKNDDKQANNLNQNLQIQEEDPLEAFMRDMNANQTLNPTKTSLAIKQKDSVKIITEDKHNKGFQDAENQDYPKNYEDYDNYDYGYQEFSEKEAINPLSQNNEEQFYDNELEDPFMRQQKKKDKSEQILKPFDFTKIQLEDFTKNFYQEHQEISKLPIEEIRKIQKQFQIIVTSQPFIKPIISFAHLNLPQKIIKVLQKQQFEKPTPIQMQALPCILSGRDLVGIAKTGSGKTLAFLIPMIIHVQAQRLSSTKEGPISLILAPTRQLCQQIFLQTRKFTKKTDIKVACVLGGQNKHEQWKTLKAGIDILIASPGRLIEMIRKKATNLQRTSYLVLDQADRMLSLGFQHQIRSICSQIREDRQTLLFTATMKKSVQMLVGDIVICPIRIRVGIENAANQDVSQEVQILNSTEEKLQWLGRNILELFNSGKILIFANQKDLCEEIGQYFTTQIRISALVMHGDKNQFERTTIMNSFKNEEAILIATDIASRGIDVKNIQTVINFEPPKTIEGYIHRIGRAGRAGATGNAITFLSERDFKFAISLIQVFENSGYPVPKELEDIAVLDDKYRMKRLASKMGVSFAKGKDATKFLNQVLKKQRKGFSRAGIGMTEDKQNQPRKEQSSVLYEQNPSKVISEEISCTEGLSISELAQVVRQKFNEKKGETQINALFVRGKQLEEKDQKFDKPTVTWFPKKQ